MKTRIRKMGNSQGVIIPKLLLEEIGVRAGDAVDMKVKKGRIVIAPRASTARAGWAEDSRKLAAAGEAVSGPSGGEGAQW
jgi:antitoxin MazE